MATQMDVKSLQTYTIEEVAKHNHEESLWIVVDNLVVDCTDFLDGHPVRIKYGEGTVFIAYELLTCHLASSNSTIVRSKRKSSHIVFTLPFLNHVRVVDVFSCSMQAKTLLRNLRPFMMVCLSRQSTFPRW